ncbi:hypothetical protein B0O40_1381 [Ruminococcaceae bacterium R-25]|nr:hypothetical protein B0O40_1381 [Ruminococcaceae bacterium R-25]SUQ11990.1 hypothetical protein SAMN06297423_1381 [Oscillospiraceae bacterium]
MQTIGIVLDPGKMSNPDLDIRYDLPERIEEYTDGKVKESAYDYLPDERMVIWLDTEDAQKNVGDVIQLISSEMILDNDLTEAAEIYISTLEQAELDQCTKVFPA